MYRYRIGSNKKENARKKERKFFFFFFLLGKKTKPGRTLQVLLFAGLNKRNSDTLKVT